MASDAVRAGPGGFAVLVLGSLTLHTSLTHLSPTTLGRTARGFAVLLPTLGLALVTLLVDVYHLIIFPTEHPDPPATPSPDPAHPAVSAPEIIAAALSLVTSAAGLAYLALPTVSLEQEQDRTQPNTNTNTTSSSPSQSSPANANEDLLAAPSMKQTFRIFQRLVWASFPATWAHTWLAVVAIVVLLGARVMNIAVPLAWKGLVNTLAGVTRGRNPDPNPDPDPDPDLSDLDLSWRRALGWYLLLLLVKGTDASFGVLRNVRTLCVIPINQAGKNRRENDTHTHTDS